MVTTTSCDEYRYAFLLLPDFSLVAFVNAVEALRMANRISHMQTYSWETLTVDDVTVVASNGMQFTPTASISDASGFNAVFLCGGTNVKKAASPELLRQMRSFARQRNVIIGALCTGSYVLAKAGLLDNHKAAIHWENLSALREEFPQVNFCRHLFVIEGDRYTCSGGIAPLDMMLNLVKQHLGSDVATTVADQFNLDRIRNQIDEQHIPLRAQIGAYHRTLLRVATLMEETIEEPLSLNQLASSVGVSRRQVERLFKHYLGRVPARYYLDLRLNRARELLLQTNMSIIDITVACGFRSPPHFSKCYRNHYGYPPSHERRSGIALN